MVILDVSGQASSLNNQLPSVPEELPILPTGSTILFPSIVMPLGSRNPWIVKLIDDAAASNKLVGVFAEKEVGDNADPEMLYEVGCAAIIIRMFKPPEGG